MKIIIIKNFNRNIEINKNLIIFIIIISLYFYFRIYIIPLITNLSSFIESHYQYKNIENFLKFTDEIKLKTKKSFKKVNNPKTSVISPLHNSERYILRFIMNIQYQNFKDLEIILIDDKSKDNTVKIIEELKKKDERIILIKNKKNKGTFISRNLGVYYAKAKYIIIPDPDDIIDKNIINSCFKCAKKYNYEIIRFNRYIGKNRVVFNDIVKNLENKALFQPELSNYIFYGNNELNIIDFWITNKYLTKEIYIRAINSLNMYYLNLNISFAEDAMINYIIYRTAKSLYFIENVGYYYIKNSISITNNLFRNSELRIKFGFIFIKLVFDYSRNTKLEKDMFNLIFSNINKNFNIIYKLSNINNDFKFYINFIYDYLRCKFIAKENKFILENYKNIINKQINNQKIDKWKILK